MPGSLWLRLLLMACRLQRVLLGLGVDDSREIDIGSLLPRLPPMEEKTRGEVARANIRAGARSWLIVDVEERSKLAVLIPAIYATLVSRVRDRAWELISLGPQFETAEIWLRRRCRERHNSWPERMGRII